MQIFVDTADPEEVKKAKEMGLADGVTTNPTLVARTGRPFEEVVQQILKMVDGPVSIEATADDTDGMVAQARKYAEWGPNVVIKIPMTIEGLRAVKILKDDQIATNVTLVFSPLQAVLAAKAGAMYVSPFVGRLDDISHHGMSLVKDVVQIYRNYNFATKVIVASVRHPLHILEAARMGADIVTVPYAVLEKIARHPLTDIGIERFKSDWQKVPK